MVALYVLVPVASLVGQLHVEARADSQQHSKQTHLYALLKAAKAYEKHVAENGAPDSHAKAKELLKTRTLDPR